MVIKPVAFFFKVCRKTKLKMTFNLHWNNPHVSYSEGEYQDVYVFK